MPESEEDLRRFLRQAVAQQRQDVERWWGRRFRLMAPDPLYGDLELGQVAEITPGLDASSSAPDPSAAPRTGAPSTAAPVLSPPKAAVVAGPAPAQTGQSVREIARALAVFGAVTVLGAGLLIAQRSPGDLKVWLFVAVALVVCAVVFIAAGRSLAADRYGPGNPPIVR